GRLPEWRLMLPVLDCRRGARLPAAEHMARYTAQTAAEPLPRADWQLINEKADPAAASLRLRAPPLSRPVIRVFGRAWSVGRQLFVPQILRPCEAAIEQETVAEVTLHLQVHCMVGVAGAVYVDRNIRKVRERTGLIHV